MMIGPADCHCLHRSITGVIPLMTPILILPDFDGCHFLKFFYRTCKFGTIFVHILAKTLLTRKSKEYGKQDLFP